VHRQCSPRRSAEKDLLTDITSPGASWPVFAVAVLTGIETVAMSAIGP